VDLKGLAFEDIEVVESPTDGIKFTSMKGHAVGDARFDRVRIVRPGGHGIVEADGATGTATITNVTVEGGRGGGVRDDAPAFKLVRGSGNVGVDQAGRALGGAPAAASR